MSPVAPPVVYISYFPDRQTGIGMINPIPVATNRLRKPIRLNCRGMCTLAAAPDGKTVYVAAVDAVIPISTATSRPGKPIHVPGRAYWIQIDPNGKVADVTGALLDKVVPINLATNTAGKPIDVGPTRHIAFSPDGTTAYMVNPYDANGTVTPIDTATNTPGKPIPVGPDPYAITITPDGKTLYVTSRNAVIPVSTATGTSGTPIRLSAPPVALAVTPDGKTPYVTGGTPHGAAHRGQYRDQPARAADPAPGAHIPDRFHPRRSDPLPRQQRRERLHHPGQHGHQPARQTDPRRSRAIMAITPDGKTPSPWPRVVVPISTATNQPGKPIRFRAKDPQGIIVAP